MNAEELKNIKDESYDRWFERWYEKEKLPSKLKQSAMKGYSSYSYTINERFSDYTQRRMNDKRFVEKLEEKLEGFNIYKVEPERYERRVLGTHIGYGWTEPKIFIDWEEEDE